MAGAAVGVVICSAALSVVDMCMFVRRRRGNGRWDECWWARGLRRGAERRVRAATARAGMIADADMNAKSGTTSMGASAILQTVNKEFMRH